MSAPDFLRQWRRALSDSGGTEDESMGSLDLIGLDMATHLKSRENRLTIPMIAAGVLAALILVGLRIDLIRMRYSSAEAVSLERELLEQKLSITVEKRRLREPKMLSRRAKELGFVHPERVIDLAARIPLAGKNVSAGPRP